MCVFHDHSIEVVRGGMTRAALRRAIILSDSHEEIGLVTFDFNPDYETIIQQLKEYGLWNKKMKISNVYEFLMGSRLEEERPVSCVEADFPDEEGEYLIDKNPEQPNLLHYYQHGRLIKSKHYKDRQVQFVDYFSEEQLEKRIQIDKSECRRKEIHYNTETSKKTKELFFTPAGTCFFWKTRLIQWMKRHSAVFGMTSKGRKRKRSGLSRTTGTSSSIH